MQETNAEFGSDFPGLVEAPLLTEDPLLEDPVASGGDSSLYVSDDGEIQTEGEAAEDPVDPSDGDDEDED